jgi:hypothetical protein
MKFVVYIVLFGMVGCATSSVWEATGEAVISIDKIDCKAFNSKIDDQYAIVYGKKTAPIVVGLINQTREGAVDSLLVEGVENKFIADFSNEDSFNGQGIDIVPIKKLKDADCSSVVLRYRGGMLLEDNDSRGGVRLRNKVAIPTVIEPMDDGREKWTIKILDKPWIPYGSRSYVVHECNAITIANRLVIVPLAVIVDVATLPFQVVLGLFVHN